MNWNIRCECFWYPKTLYTCLCVMKVLGFLGMSVEFLFLFLHLGEFTCIFLVKKRKESMNYD